MAAHRIAAVAVAAVTSLVALAAPPASASEPVAPFVVTLASPSDTAPVAVAADRGPSEVTDEFHAVGALAAELTPSQVDALRRDPRVVSVTPDTPIQLFDTQAAAPWGLDRIDQSALPLSNTYTWRNGGAGVKVYVLDTGTRTSHQEFTGRTAEGFGALSSNPTEDCNGHGTHVASTAAGTTYGVAKLATVVPVRVFTCDGSGSVSTTVAGLDWMITDHTAGPAVANMSLGASADATLDAAVNRAIADGITVVAAAGNSNIDACSQSPARVPGVITVGATTPVDARASFSNWGRCVDLFAPGQEITAAWRTGDSDTHASSGTSMAAPHVTGGAALYLAAHPWSTPAEVHAALIAAARTGAVGAPGSGSPNRLLQVGSLSAVPPAAPAAPTVTAGNAQATVTWDAPSTDNDSATTGYRIQVLKGTKVAATVVVTTPATRTKVVTGLPNNQTYTAQVAATSAAGTSAWSDASASFQPFAPRPPGRPATITATRSSTQVALTWTAPTDAGTSARTGYTVVASTPGRPTVTRTLGADDTSSTFTGLTNGVRYSFTVAATNAVGTGAPATTSALPAGTPTAPAAPTATTTATGPTTARVVLRWAAGGGNGESVTGYRVTATTGGVATQSIATSTTATFTATRGASYQVVVATRTAVGLSADSAPLTFTVA